MATHFSILAWKIPYTEEPDGLQSMGLQRVGHDWARTHTHPSSHLSQRPSGCPASRTLLQCSQGCVAFPRAVGNPRTMSAALPRVLPSPLVCIQAPGQPDVMSLKHSWHLPCPSPSHPLTHPQREPHCPYLASKIQAVHYQPRHSGEDRALSWLKTA